MGRTNSALAWSVWPLSRSTRMRHKQLSTWLCPEHKIRLAQHVRGPDESRAGRVHTEFDRQVEEPWSTRRSRHSPYQLFTGPMS